MYSALHAKGKNLCDCLIEGMRMIGAPKTYRGGFVVTVRSKWELIQIFCAVIKIYSVSLSAHKHLIIFDEVASYAA